MPRPSFFKDKKAEVLLFVKALSKEYRERHRSLSLGDIAQELRRKFELPPAPTKLKKNGQPKTDPLKLVIYRLCNSNGIWFGDPELVPSRMKSEEQLKAAAEVAEKKKKERVKREKSRSKKKKKA